MLSQDGQSELLEGESGEGIEVMNISSSVSQLPRADVLVENDLRELRGISDEVKQKIQFLFILAHPDDEATHLIYIKVLQDLGFPVEILWLTFGDGSTEIETKKAESRKVLSSIDSVKYEFLPNSVHDLTQEAFRGSEVSRSTMLKKIIQQIRGKIQNASVVVTNAFEGGHLLHDFTHVISRAVAEKEGKEVLEIPQYSLKTLKGICISAIHAMRHWQWGDHVLYNVGNFREGCDQGEHLSVTADENQIKLPSKLTLTNTGVASKAGLIRLYQSQWESVFTRLLGIVEVNGTQNIECIRKARKVPGLYSTIMHFEKIIKSWFGSMIPPRKLYEVQKEIDFLVQEDA
ncbi:MAG: PIG-L family deacetylase [Candidatus Altimarinota bacterium]